MIYSLQSQVPFQKQDATKMQTNPTYFVFGEAQQFIHGLDVQLTRSMEQEFTDNDNGEWKAQYDYIVKHKAIPVPADKDDPAWPAAEAAYKKIGIDKVIKKRDLGHDGYTLDDFCKCEDARKAELTRAEVAALRAYSGPPYEPLNAALRNKNIGPWATTISLCYSGIIKLSMLAKPARVYRGVREVDLELPPSFLENATQGFAGGIELVRSQPTSHVALAPRNSHTSLLASTTLNTEHLPTPTHGTRPSRVRPNRPRWRSTTLAMGAAPSWSSTSTWAREVRRSNSSRSFHTRRSSSFLHSRRSSALSTRSTA